ncbi:MAG: M23 family metallopeptidase [Emcibacter sp.]|nr:M23 family metallopeptidase [Emcibacter sp.]
MRTPIEGARLSSYYGKRKHPVLGYTRMHKGLDFSAPTGTPIMAAGDGIVERASRYGSYGNYVRIRHNSTYKTAYAHLSKYGRGVKAGKRVKQGQIIGYVGATGRVTGRHLHYEVIMNGKQVNPLRLKIPTGITLKGKDRKIFQTLAGDVGHRIMARKQNILLTWNQKVALNDVTTNNGGPAILFGGF